MKKWMILIFMLLLMLPSVGQAQDEKDFTDEERELIAFVAAAYENLAAITSYESEVSQSITQDIDTSGTTIKQIIEQDFVSQIHIDPDEDINRSYTKMEQYMSSDMGLGSPVEVNAILELVMYDGVLYMRYNEPQPGIPSGWFDAQDILGSIMNIEQLAQMANPTLPTYSFSEESILSIEELDSETLDDQEMRVFEIVMDSEYIFTSGAMSNLFDFSSYGIDTEDMLNEFATGTELTVQIWIGVDDKLPHKVTSDMTSDITMEVQNISMDLLQNTTSETTLFNFGKPVKIEEPVIGE